MTSQSKTGTGVEKLNVLSPPPTTINTVTFSTSATPSNDWNHGSSEGGMYPNKRHTGYAQSSGLSLGGDMAWTTPGVSRP
ncbi:hypothetical protein BT69DRAFT_130266 [Atractiella rhizophila]|nr:hypothetical protein BT69DRAFT_130266 [Atractiella rhizophila]